MVELKIWFPGLLDPLATGHMLGGGAVNKAMLDREQRKVRTMPKISTKASVVLTLCGNSRADVMSLGCLDLESRSSKKLAFVKLRKRQ